jgi:hypothetical protein
MKILRILLLAGAVCCGGAVPTMAQGVDAPSPEALEVAKELLSVISPDMLNDMNSKMVAQMWPPFEQSVRDRFPNVTSADWAELRSEFEQITVAATAAQWSEMPAIYARYLTIAELREILAFYRTPTGAKTLTIMPQIARDMSATIDVAAMFERIRAAFNKILNQRGYDTR